MGNQKLIGVSNNIVTVKNEIQTDIFNGGTSEFFINMNPKDIPPKDHPDRGDFVRRERQKCRTGLIIGGVWIPGNLYFHLNYFKTAVDIGLDSSGKTITNVQNPTFRDTEWIVHTDYANAMKQQKGYTLASCRQLSKSSILVSLALRETSLYKGSESLIVFGADTDKQTFTKKMQDAINVGESFMIVENIDKDWKGNLIRFGDTNTDNSINEKAKLFLYNSVNGTKTEVGVGKSLSFFAMDEIGTYPFRAVWEAVEPAIKGDFGYRCVPYFSWTGGESSKADAAFNFTLNPKASNLLEFETEGKPTARILFADYRKETKIEIPFSTFLSNNNIVYDENNYDIQTLKIKVSDIEAARALTAKELEDKKKDKDATAWIKYKSYYPLCIKDILTKPNTSSFKSEYIYQQREYLKSGAVDVTAVELFRDLRSGEVKHKLSSKPFVTDWKNPGYTTDAAIKVFDFPKYTSYGVHVLGVDCVREDEVGSSDSLGYITVLRRNHSDLTDNFRGKQVASYLGRCRTVKEFHQMLLDLAEWYNGQILYEHSDRDLLSFFENKHKTHLLVDTVPLQREINVLTKTKNTKGLRPTVTNKKFLINSTLGWVNDELEDDTLGYAKIFDDILLQQLEAYDPDENLDAYIGFSHAVAAYNYFEKFGTPVVTLNNKIEEKKKTPPIIKNAFGMSFKHKPKNAFGI